MTFQELLVKVVDWVQRGERVSYRAIKRQFDLDDEYLDDLKEGFDTADLREAKALLKELSGASPSTGVERRQINSQSGWWVDFEKAAFKRPELS